MAARAKMKVRIRPSPFSTRLLVNADLTHCSTIAHPAYRCPIPIEIRPHVGASFGVAVHCLTPASSPRACARLDQSSDISQRSNRKPCITSRLHLPYFSDYSEPDSRAASRPV
jgi:hypothetical protein